MQKYVWKTPEEIAMVLDVSEDIKNIFTEVPYKSIQEVINEQE